MENKKQVRILIVDDNQAVRKGLTALLNSIGNRKKHGLEITVVGEAANGLEAVALAQELAPDLIFMDIKMPLLDGLKATEIIKQQVKNTKVILLSMHIALKETALAAGADAFIEKGTESKIIKQIISRITTSKGERDERTYLDY